MLLKYKKMVIIQYHTYECVNYLKFDIHLHKNNMTPFNGWIMPHSIGNN